MKKLKLIIFLFLIVFASCTTTTDTNKLAKEKDLEIVEKYQLALKNFDYEALDSLLADNYMSYGPSLADSMGREDLLVNWKYNMEHLYDKLEYMGAQNVVVARDNNGQAEDWVSSWGKLRVKYKENGNEAIIWTNTIFQIANGKIQKSIMFFNEADALRQMGYKYTYSNPNPVK